MSIANFNKIIYTPKNNSINSYQCLVAIHWAASILVSHLKPRHPRRIKKMQFGQYQMPGYLD